MLPFRSTLRRRRKNEEEKKKRRIGVNDRQCCYDVGETANRSSLFCDAVCLATVMKRMERRQSVEK